MTKDELLKIVIKVLSDHNGDKQATVRSLNIMCANNDKMMIAFAKHGYEIMLAINEKQSATLQ